MSKRKIDQLDTWNDFRAFWNDRGPDPRIQKYEFKVNSRDILLDPSDPFAKTTEEDWTGYFQTFKGAANAYKKRITRKKTKACEIEFHMKFGCCYTRHKEPLHPHFEETWIYLVRWREDGAFLESYHTNESKFGERNHGRKTNELTEMTQTPGLMTHWTAEYEKRKKKKKKKKKKTMK